MGGERRSSPGVHWVYSRWRLGWRTSLLIVLLLLLLVLMLRVLLLLLLLVVLLTAIRRLIQLCRAAGVQRYSRNQFEDVLDDDLAVGLRIGCFHDCVNPGVQRSRLVPSTRTRGDDRRQGCTPAIPEATNLCPSDDLYQASAVDVSDLDEPRVEDDDVWRVERHTLGRAFPLDNAVGAVGVTMAIDVKSEFCA